MIKAQSRAGRPRPRSPARAQRAAQRARGSRRRCRVRCEAGRGKGRRVSSRRDPEHCSDAQQKENDSRAVRQVDLAGRQARDEVEVGLGFGSSGVRARDRRPLAQACEMREREERPAGQQGETRLGWEGRRKEATHALRAPRRCPGRGPRHPPRAREARCSTRTACPASLRGEEQGGEPTSVSGTRATRAASPYPRRLTRWRKSSRQGAPGKGEQRDAPFVTCRSVMRVHLSIATHQPPSRLRQLTSTTRRSLPTCAASACRRASEKAAEGNRYEVTMTCATAEQRGRRGQHGRWRASRRQQGAGREGTDFRGAGVEPLLRVGLVDAASNLQSSCECASQARRAISIVRRASGPRWGQDGARRSGTGAHLARPRAPPSPPRRCWARA